MFTNDWLKKIQEEYGTNDDIHINNYEHLLNHLRATDENTPSRMTANLLKRLLTGENVREISRIMGLSARYNDLLGLFNYYDKEAAQIKEKAADPSVTDEEKKELKAKWETAWEKREAYWTSMQIICVPLSQLCFDIEGHKHMWYVDIDRIV